MEFNENEKAMIDAIKTQTNEIYAEKAKGLISEKAFNDGVSELQKANAENAEAMKAIAAQLEANKQALMEQGLSLKDVQAQSRIIAPNTFKSQVQSALESRTEELKSLQHRRTEMVLNFKTVADMTTANYTTGTVGVSQYDSEIGRPARRRAMLQDVVSKRRVTTAYVAWADHANAEGGAASQGGEAAAKSQADFELVESNKRVETIAAYVTASKQSLEDVPFLVDTINTELRELVELKLEDQLLTGAGNSNTLKGIQTYATAWTETGYLVDLVESATIYDVLINGQAQIAAANHYATHIVMNPIDIAKMISTSRATDGVYLNPNFATPNTSGLAGVNVGMINGMQIISTNACGSGKFYIMDATKSVLGMREDFTVTLGLNSDNFTKNMLTMLGEVRAVHYIKSNNTTAFIYGSSFATAIAALEKP